MKQQLNFKWGLNNGKLKSLSRANGGIKVASFDILAGYTCPAASICKAWYNPAKHKVERGPESEFLCYAAKTEGVYPASFAAHEFNLKKLNYVLKNESPESLALLLVDDIRSLHLSIVRIHSSGDLFNPLYVQAWIIVAKMLPDVQFFGYTKVYSAFRMITDSNLDNLKFAFSIGSRDDYLVKSNDCTCTVITSDEQAAQFAHDIICTHESDYEYSNDFEYIMRGESFGIGLH